MRKSMRTLVSHAHLHMNCVNVETGSNCIGDVSRLCSMAWNPL